MDSRKSITAYRHSLSTRESEVLSTLSSRGKTIFTTGDLKEFIQEPKNLLDNLSRKKWILRMKKGVYAIAPLEAGKTGAAAYTLHSFAIASYLVEPYYIGYWSALNYHGLTDQTPPAVYIATTKPRNSRRMLDTEFRFVTIPARKLFGVAKVEIEKREVNVSSAEKTVVDCLDHPEHSGGMEEVARAIQGGEIDFKRLVDCAERLGNGAVLKRLGYMADALNVQELLRLLSDVKLSKGYSVLDPTMPKRGKITERWRLVVNVPLGPTR